MGGNVQDTAKAELNADVLSGLANYGQQVVGGNANWVAPTSESDVDPSATTLGAHEPDVDMSPGDRKKAKKEKKDRSGDESKSEKKLKKDKTRDLSKLEQKKEKKSKKGSQNTAKSGMSATEKE